MPMLHAIALLLSVLPLSAPDLLREPGYSVVRVRDRWLVQKPGVAGRPPVVIAEHRHLSRAERQRRSLPRVRLNRPFVRLDPGTHARTVIADWSKEPDAQEVAADVDAILNRFAPSAVRALFPSTPVYLARLFGASGYTAEGHSADEAFVVYLDPFRATGRLHAAATLVHEFTHLERYRERGFHANRAASVLPKEDFVLLGLADEFAAFEAEANLLRSFLRSQGSKDVHEEVGDIVRRPEFNWPLALVVMLGFDGPGAEAPRTLEARRQVSLDLAGKAGSYWEARRTHVLDPAMRDRILAWYQHSREWKTIAAQRSEWRRAASRANSVGDE